MRKKDGKEKKSLEGNRKKSCLRKKWNRNPKREIESLRGK